MEYLACYITIYNKSSHRLESGRATAEWGKYTVSPGTQVPPGGSTMVTIMGRENSPSGCEGTCSYTVTGEPGMGGVAFYYTCPMSGDNRATAQANSLAVRCRVYAQIDRRQGMAPASDQAGTQWGMDGKNWGTEGSVPGSGYPVSILFVVEDAQPGKSAPGPAPTRLLSYNTHLFHQTVPGITQSYDEERRIQGITGRVAASGADVVGLSEVWADAVKDSIAASLKAQYPYSFYHPNDETFALGSGLLLLSKHPLTDCTYTRYVGLVNNDRFAGKGFYTARVNVATPGGPAPFWVAFTHAQAGSSAEEVQVRAGHMQDLAQAIGRLPYGGSRVVLLGDLNICAEVKAQETAEYQQLKKFLEPYGLRDVCRAVHPSAAADPMYTYDYFTNKLAKHFAPDEKVSQRLDYVFASGMGTGPAAHVTFSSPTDWKYTEPSGATTDLSDHYPLVVAFGQG